MSNIDFDRLNKKAFALFKDGDLTKLVPMLSSATLDVNGQTVTIIPKDAEVVRLVPGALPTLREYKTTGITDFPVVHSVIISYALLSKMDNDDSIFNFYFPLIINESLKQLTTVAGDLQLRDVVTFARPGLNERAFLESENVAGAEFRIYASARNGGLNV